ncbi:Rad2 nuclease [Podila verticillata]|nr:Rad2 nuclease [Podila verticillata]
MGIQGLLPLVKSIEKPVNLKDYAGMTLAVDGYVWLHKGAFACAQEICLGQPTDKYVKYFMRQIHMFNHFGVKPYVVFDGGYLPSKAATEVDRLSRREESKKQAMELLQSGKSKEALEQFRRCVDVTPDMAHAVIQALEACRIDFVVAPYEADAQLAYLEMNGIVDGIVTEDSDLLVFGCKRMIFKLDKYGSGIEIRHDNLRMVQEVSFHDWSMTEIRHMCILAGCDYLPSIPGMGLKTAQRLLRKLKTFDKVIRYVRMENTSMKVQADYEESFRRADLTFLYARVYDPTTKSMVHLNPVPDELQAVVDTDEYNFLGPLLNQQTVHGIATGKLNPISKEPLVTVKAWAGPSHSHKPQFKFGGKENKALQTPPTSKAISSFFVKKPAPHLTKPQSTVLKLTTSTQPSTPNREPFSGVESVASKENTPEPKDLIAHQPGVVVVSRSRFFGFEPEKEAEGEKSLPIKTSVSTTDHRSTTIREDSGIGLEERNDDSKAPCPSLSLDMAHSQGYQSEASSPSEFEASQQSTCSQEEYSQETSSSQAERVIQGWREKFSHTSGSPCDTRSVGLTRAVQTASKVQRSFTIKSTTSQSSGAFSKPSFTKTSSVVRTTLGHPTYSMDTPAKSRVARPSQTSFVGLSNKRATAPMPEYPPRPAPGPSRPKAYTSADVDEGPSPSPMLLNLDRFKYTPSSI